MQGSSGDAASTFDGNTAAAAEGGMQSSPGTGTGFDSGFCPLDRRHKNGQGVQRRRLRLPVLDHHLK